MSEYFKKNLKHLRTKNGIEQQDLAEMLGYKSASAVSEWEKGVRVPNAGILSDLANIFNVRLDDLMGKDLTKSIEEYYMDEGTKQLAQELLEREELKILFDAARNVKKEDIKYIQDLVDRLKEK